MCAEAGEERRGVCSLKGWQSPARFRCWGRQEEFQVDSVRVGEIWSMCWGGRRGLWTYVVGLQILCKGLGGRVLPCQCTGCIVLPPSSTRVGRGALA